MEGPAIPARGLRPNLTGRAGAKTWDGPYLWAHGEISTATVKKTVKMKAPQYSDYILIKLAIVAAFVATGVTVLPGEVSFDHVAVVAAAVG